MNNIKLFCFPYAGGSSLIFNNWKVSLNPSIELFPVELAGRGRRLFDPLYDNLPAVVEDAFNMIRPEILESPYAFFGHSLGCLLAYELSQKIMAENLPMPIHIFFSGRRAPHFESVKKKKFHLMNDAEFKREVIELGGTPAEFFDHPELLEIFLPVLKNDFRIAETEQLGEIIPFDSDITVFLGKDEQITAEQVDGWKLHTQHLCNIHYFKGGHFFINDEMDKMAKIINNTLLPSYNLKH